jgi:hypothetical protein
MTEGDCRLLSNEMAAVRVKDFERVKDDTMTDFNNFSHPLINFYLQGNN